MTDTPPPADWAGPLAARLAKLADPAGPDRAALAHLCRGLGSAGYALARVGWLFRGVPDDRDGRALDAAVLVAGLFAWVKGECPHAPGVNFGRAFAAGLTDDQRAQREKRFTALLDADRPDLPYRLRQAVTLARGAGLDWALLARQVHAWDHPGRWVQREWARGFWSAPDAAAPAPAAESPTPTS